MKEVYSFFIKTLPFTIGIILTLISLTFLVEFSYFEDEEFWSFLFFATIGIPTLLYGINKVSNENL